MGMPLHSSLNNAIESADFKERVYQDIFPLNPPNDHSSFFKLLRWLKTEIKLDYPLTTNLYKVCLREYQIKAHTDKDPSRFSLNWEPAEERWYRILREETVAILNEG